MGRNSDFEAYKLCLVSVQHLEKHQRIRPERRADLIQSLLRGDFDHAQRLLSDDGRDKKPATIFRAVVSAIGTLFSSPSGAEPLKEEMKSVTAQLPDSQFLLQLKGIYDEELLPIIQHIEFIAHSVLTSLIDKTVESITDEMAAMQQEHCRSAIEDRFRTEEMKLQNGVLIEFIRGLNTQSAGRQDS